MTTNTTMIWGQVAIQILRHIQPSDRIVIKSDYSREWAIVHDLVVRVAHGQSWVAPPSAAHTTADINAILARQGDYRDVAPLVAQVGARAAVLSVIAAVAVQLAETPQDYGQAIDKTLSLALQALAPIQWGRAHEETL